MLFKNLNWIKFDKHLQLVQELYYMQLSIKSWEFCWHIFALLLDVTIAWCLLCFPNTCYTKMFGNCFMVHFLYCFKFPMGTATYTGRNQPVCSSIHQCMSLSVQIALIGEFINRLMELCTKKTSIRPISLERFSHHDLQIISNNF